MSANLRRLQARLAAKAIALQPNLEIPRFGPDGTELKTVEQIAAAMGIPVAEAKGRIIRRVRDLAKWRDSGYDHVGQIIGSLGDEPPSKPKVKKPRAVKRVAAVGDLSSLRTARSFKSKVYQWDRPQDDEHFPPEIRDAIRYMGEFEYTAPNGHKYKTVLDPDNVFISVSSHASIRIGMDVYVDEGFGYHPKPIGHVTRTLAFDEMDAYNSGFHIDPEYQGQGFAEALGDHFEGQLAAHGFERLHVTANDDVGGYAWAMRGFEWDRFPTHDHLLALSRIGLLLEMVADRKKTVPRADEEYPLTDEQIAQLREWRRMFDLASIEQIPIADLPSPHTLATFGMVDGPWWVSITAGGREYPSWIGKEIMLRTEWRGTRSLNPDDYEAKDDITPRDYLSEVRAMIPAEEAAWRAGDYVRTDKKPRYGGGFNVLSADVMWKPSGFQVETKDVFSGAATHALGVGVGTQVTELALEDRRRRVTSRKKKRRRRRRPTQEEQA